MISSTFLNTFYSEKLLFLHLDPDPDCMSWISCLLARHNSGEWKIYSPVISCKVSWCARSDDKALKKLQSMLDMEVWSAMISAQFNPLPWCRVHWIGAYICIWYKYLYITLVNSHGPSGHCFMAASTLVLKNMPTFILGQFKISF